MSARKILIYTNALNYKNGGSASMVLYAKALCALNMDVTIWNGRVSKLKYFYEKISIKLPKLRIVNDFPIGKKYDLIIASFGIDIISLRKIKLLSNRIYITHTGDYDCSKLEWYQTCLALNVTFICQSIEHKNILKNMGYTVRVITPPCNEEILVNFREQSLRSGPNMIYIGSVQMRKNQKKAVEIFHHLKNSKHPFHHLYLVGNLVKDEHYSELKRYIQTHKLSSHVTVTGFKKNYYKYYSDASCCISTSSSEGFATSIREAMYLGKYIIAPKIPGNIGQLTDDISDLININSSPIEIARQIEKSLTAKSITEFGNHAQQHYDSNYSKKYFLEALENL